VTYYARKGISGAEAARLAGYSDAKQAAWSLLCKPHIRQAVRASREAAISGDLAKLALETLADLMRPETPAPVRLGASRTALEMAGHLGARLPDKPLSEKPLGEMTVAELEKFISEGQDALATVKIVPGAVIVTDSAPDSAPV
jgi:hypothetical protein